LDGPGAVVQFERLRLVLGLAVRIDQLEDRRSSVAELDARRVPCRAGDVGLTEAQLPPLDALVD